jgi:hypothetical protein
MSDRPVDRPTGHPDYRYDYNHPSRERHKMFARIGRLVRGFFSLFISGLEEANPEALMEAAKQEFRSKMTAYNLASPNG